MLVLDIVRPLPVPLRRLNAALVALLARVVMPRLMPADRAIAVDAAPDGSGGAT